MYIAVERAVRAPVETQPCLNVFQGRRPTGVFVEELAVSEVSVIE